METPVLQAIGITKSYDGQAILRGVNLSVAPGEYVAILGRSGAGKSTLLHILGALDRPDNGSVLFRGEDVGRMSVSRLHRWRNRHVGFIFQFHHLLPELTALENVALPARIAGCSEAEATSKAMRWLELAGLGGCANKRPSELSGGEQQRVATVRAFVNDPDLVLADEPTGNLDTGTALQLLHVIREVRRERPDLAMVVVTHQQEVAAMAQSQYFLREGILEKMGNEAGL